MVKFRGIEVNVVSQFDIRKIPEFSPRKSNDPFHNDGPTLRSDDNSVASCYVPIYPGSQIWLEYSIDAPHPPDAAYFFKMVHNGQFVTSWDCTAKHGYHGKMAYNLQYLGNDNITGLPLVKRQAFKFSPRDRKNVGPFDDCIEVRVHRIEHRQRIPLDSALITKSIIPDASCTDGMFLVNSCLLEAANPKRRYRYQLLDPADEPYATIRFFYRSYGFLEEQSIAPYRTKECRSSSATSSNSWSYHSASPKCKRSTSVPELSRSSSTSSSSDGTTKQQGTTQCRAPITSSTLPTSDKPKASHSSHKDAASEAVPELTVETCSPQRTSSIPPHDSDEALHVTAKDSLENLHALPTRTQTMSPPPFMPNPVVPALLSPRKLHKKDLTLHIDTPKSVLEKKKRRPMSPFTSGGKPRWTHSPVPPSAPAAVTEFGPTVAEEVEAQIAKEKAERQLQRPPVPKVSTTRAERGGQILLGFLGRRFGRSERVSNA